MKRIKVGQIVSVVLVVVFLLSFPLKANATGSAGLFTQLFAGNYKIDVINLHSGWAGPWAETANITHTNIHVYQKDNFGNYTIHKANLHISAKTTLTGSICWYIYDSVTGKQKTNCHGLLAISEAKTEMQNEVKTMLNDATNWQIVGTIAVVALVVIIAWTFWPASAVALVAI